MTINVTLRYGVSNELTRAVDAGTTVGQVLRNTSFQAALGFGSNTQAVIDGVVQRDTAPLSDGDVITIETKANAKASK